VSDSVVVADADALVALVLEKDPNHKRAQRIVVSLRKRLFTVIFPVTVFPEAITSLKRAANQPKKAHLINRQYLAGAFQVEYIGADIMKKAAEIFDSAGSKQNTLFNAIVAATAKKLDADAIFSFDGWYPKLGFVLAEE
jgi:predicted nucleic acid-binding protein